MQSFIVRARVPRGESGVWLWPFGDTHLGSETCHYDLIQRVHQEAIARRAYVLGMGDTAEVATKDSPGASVHNQQLPVTEQFGFAIQLFRPFVDADRCLGIHDGNHERRLDKYASASLTELMCRALDPIGKRGLYLRGTALFVLAVGAQRYTILSRHGSSGARLRSSKMRACRLGRDLGNADLYLMGHVHDLASETEPYRYVDPETGRQSQRLRTYVLTGHYVGWDGSYAEDLSLPPTPLGSPFVWFGARRWEVRADLSLAT